MGVSWWGVVGILMFVYTLNVLILYQSTTF